MKKNRLIPEIIKNWEKWVATIALIASLFALNSSCESNTIANTANELSHNSNSTAIEGLTLSTKLESFKIIREAFDTIYNDPTNSLVLEKLKTGKQIKDIKNLGKLVDVGEEIGQSLCHGRIYRVDIKDQLRDFFEVICNNQKILETYKKNGLAMACYEINPKSLFEKTIIPDNISNCEFLDKNNRLNDFVK